MKLTLIAVASLTISLVLPGVSAGSSQGDVSLPAGADSSLYRHDPYDLSQAAEVDSGDVYVSPPKSILALPQVVLTYLVHPLGRLTVYAEHADLALQVYELFVNEDRTFGVFPQAMLGGETGSGGGLRVFHINLAGKRKIFTGTFTYSGGRGQIGEWLYLDPSISGSSFFWKLEGLHLRTRNRSATVNSAVKTDPSRLFRLNQFDSIVSIGWRRHTGRLFYYKPELKVEGWIAYGWRDFRRVLGGSGPIVHPGSTPQASTLSGLGEEQGLFRIGGRVSYDDRDYVSPTRTLSHPLNYRFPGRIVTQADGLYYHFRDLGYPERGGYVGLEAEHVSGSEDVKFYRVAAEVQRFFTLFWRNRILAVRTRVEKVGRVGDGRIPYVELPTLGGGKQLRGYRRGYFRGKGTLLLNVEYRYPIWDTWNAFLFWDEGQAFDLAGDLDLGDFRSCWGGGISFRSETGLMGKIQAGHSAAERLLLAFTMGQEF